MQFVHGPVADLPAHLTWLYKLHEYDSTQIGVAQTFLALHVKQLSAAAPALLRRRLTGAGPAGVAEDDDGDTDDGATSDWWSGLRPSESRDPDCISRGVSTS